MNLPLPDRARNALEKLIQGNTRFQQGLRSVEHFPTPTKLGQLATQGQRPFSIILSCADSRVPSELVFDQGLGDLFVLRVAGNVVAPSLIASIEFAVTQFETPLIVVMGHSKCGAVNAALSHYNDPKPLPSRNLEDLVERIRPAVERHYPKNKKDAGVLDACGVANVHHSIEQLQAESPILRAALLDRKIGMIPAFFCLETGRVEFNPTVESKLKNQSSLCDSRIDSISSRV